MARPEKVSLTDLLVQQNLISQDQLKFVFAEQLRTDASRGACWWITTLSPRSRLPRCSLKHLDIPYVNLKYYNVNPGLVKLLPENQARRSRAHRAGRAQRQIADRYG